MPSTNGNYFFLSFVLPCVWSQDIWDGLEIVQTIVKSNSALLFPLQSYAFHGQQTAYSLISVTTVPAYAYRYALLSTFEELLHVRLHGNHHASG